MAYKQLNLVIPVRNSLTFTKVLVNYFFQLVLQWFVTSTSGLILDRNSYIAHPPDLQRSSSFTIWFHNNVLHVSFAVTPYYSTENSICNTLSWITVSHHPGDVIVISSNSPSGYRPWWSLHPALSRTSPTTY